MTILNVRGSLSFAKLNQWSRFTGRCADQNHAGPEPGGGALKAGRDPLGIALEGGALDGGGMVVPGSPGGGALAGTATGGVQLGPGGST